jgi:hypothetical protein
VGDSKIENITRQSISSSYLEQTEIAQSSKYEITDDISQAIVESSLVTEKTDPLYLYVPPTKALDNNTWLSIEGTYDNTYNYFITNGFNMEFYTISPDFIALIGENEYNQWVKEIRDNKEPIISPTISDTVNLYTFICQFNLSEAEIRKGIFQTQNNEYDQTVDFEYMTITSFYREFTEEQIQALCERDKEKITKLFSYDFVIIKGDKYYSVDWIFSATVKEYREAELTLDELLKVLGFLKTHNLYHANFEKSNSINLRVHPYTYDLLEQNIYTFADGNIDILKLCGYNRDFSMPLAYNYFTKAVDEGSYVIFHNFYAENWYSNYLDYMIQKDENIFSPHWVYYNLPSAYRSAGITPQELQEMLPKYRELGILSEEAMMALEEKINGYEG